MPEVYLGAVLLALAMAVALGRPRSFPWIIGAFLPLLDVAVIALPDGTLVRLPPTLTAPLLIYVLRTRSARIHRGVGLLGIAMVALSIVGLMTAPSTLIVPESSQIGHYTKFTLAVSSIGKHSFKQLAYWMNFWLLAALLTPIAQAHQKKFIGGLLGAGIATLATGATHLILAQTTMFSTYAEIYNMVISPAPVQALIATNGIGALGRASSVAGEPSFSGTLLASLMPAAATRSWRLTVAFGIGALFVGAVTGFISLALALIFLAMRAARRLPGLALGTAILAPAVGLLVRDRLQWFAQGQGSGQTRAALLAHNWQVFTASPFVGIGFGQDRTLSLLMSILVSTGVLGLAVLTMTIVVNQVLSRESIGRSPLRALSIIQVVGAAISFSEGYAQMPLIAVSIGLLASHNGPRAKHARQAAEMPKRIAIGMD